MTDRTNDARTGEDLGADEWVLVPAPTVAGEEETEGLLQALRGEEGPRPAEDELDLRGEEAEIAAYRYEMEHVLITSYQTGGTGE